MVSSNVSCRSIFEWGENTAWPKKPRGHPHAKSSSHCGDIRDISFRCSERKWSSRPHVFSNAARENISTYALVQGPPCYAGSQFQHPQKCSDLKSKTCETTKEVCSGEMIWIDMPFHNPQISFLPLVLHPSPPRGWHTTVPPWSPGLDSWHICSDVCSEFDTQLTEPWRFVSHLVWFWEATRITKLKNAQL